MDVHVLLTYLAIKYHGDWDDIMHAIDTKADYYDQNMDEVVNSLKCKCVTILDPEYPECLKNIYKPPFALFYYGDFSLLNDIKNNLSVVGSREPSSYGAEMTDYLVKDIRARYRIVSGLAAGIDTIAHKAAIESGAKTIAVLGTAIDFCYPFENKKLYSEIKKNHLLISEYPNTPKPNSNTFPMRNRLIAAFSSGVLVTDAKNKSGTSITVNYGLMYGRHIMTIPHPLGHESSCNRLINDGAFFVENGQDITDIMSLEIIKK